MYTKQDYKKEILKTIEENGYDPSEVHLTLPGMPFLPFYASKKNLYNNSSIKLKRQERHAWQNYNRMERW